MILPSKHINFSESLMGLGGALLRLLKKPMSIDDLWMAYSKINNKSKFPSYHSFDNVVLALNYLFMINAVGINEEGSLFKITLNPPDLI